MENQLIPVNEIKEMAVQACKSGLFQMPNESAAFTLMMVCQSEGLHPIQALKRYHIIKGRPSMRADAMLAEFQRLGGKVEWLERSDKACTATFSHDQGGSVTVDWTIEMAKSAGLTSNDTWRKYPRQMLTARVISEGVRTVFPGVVTGIYTPEEVSDFDTIPAKPVEKPAKPVAKTAKKAEKAPAKDEKIISDAEIIQEQAEQEAEKTQFERLVRTEQTEEFSADEAKPGIDIKKAERPKKEEPETTGAEVAAQLGEIRKLSVAYGCKSPAEMKALTESIIERKINSAHDLSGKERQIVIDWLTLENKKQQKAAA